jgi:hypothetical protein
MYVLCKIWKELYMYVILISDDYLRAIAISSSPLFAITKVFLSYMPLDYNFYSYMPSTLLFPFLQPIYFENDQNALIFNFSSLSRSSASPSKKFGT